MHTARCPCREANATQEGYYRFMVFARTHTVE